MKSIFRSIFDQKFYKIHIGKHGMQQLSTKSRPLLGGINWVSKESFLEVLNRKLKKYPEWLREELKEELIKEFEGNY